MNTWKYYNNSLSPNLAPNILPDITPILNGTEFKNNKSALMATWISNFDLPAETNWYYVIKDSSFDISELKAKRRYEITKGNKNFFVERINPKNYKKELYKVITKAFTAYNSYISYNVSFNSFSENIDVLPEHMIYYAAFSRETNEMCGYAWLSPLNDSFISYTEHKVIPEFEKLGINAAIVSKIMDDFCDYLSQGKIISNGQRNLYHDTNFHNYLEKYFGFRKAFCELHIVYRKPVGLIVKLLYPFRKLLIHLDKIGFFHKINAVLEMENIAKPGNRTSISKQS